VGRQAACGITTDTFPKSPSALGSVRSAAPQTQTRLMFPDDGVACALPLCCDALPGLSILLLLRLVQALSSPSARPRPPHHHLPWGLLEFLEGA